MKIKLYNIADFKKTLQDKGIKDVRKEILQKTRVEKQEAVTLPTVETYLILTSSDGADLFEYLYIIDYTHYFFLQNSSRPEEETKAMQELKKKVEQVERWLEEEFKDFYLLPGVIETV